MNNHEKLTYSVGIIGMGFVGTALSYLFPEAICHDLVCKNTDAYTQDIIFICVPTNELEDGRCDVSRVEQCIKQCREDAIVVCKSTVPPTAIQTLNTIHSRLVFNPEFLTERNWKSDLKNESRLILGGKKADCTAVAHLYQKVYSEMSFYYCTAEEAMLTKYVNNAFLATKVAFANEMRSIAESLDISWDTVRELWITDPRVGKSHTVARGGFGGYCLPKDTQALYHISHSRLLAAVLTYRHE